jgi:hypothetical protein
MNLWCVLPSQNFAQFKPRMEIMYNFARATALAFLAGCLVAVGMVTEYTLINGGVIPFRTYEMLQVLLLRQTMYLRG